MGDYEEARYDIVRQHDQGGEAERQKAAVLQTRSLLSMWRGRFVTDEVAKSYQRDEDTVHVRSNSSSQVYVRVEKEGDTLTYEFDVEREVPLSVVETVEGARQEVGGDMVSHHYNLAQLLYGCDRIEARG
jgi:hypothetical protein